MPSNRPGFCGNHLRTSRRHELCGYFRYCYSHNAILVQHAHAHFLHGILACKIGICSSVALVNFHNIYSASSLCVCVCLLSGRYGVISLTSAQLLTLRCRSLLLHIKAYDVIFFEIPLGDCLGFLHVVAPKQQFVKTSSQVYFWNFQMSPKSRQKKEEIKEQKLFHKKGWLFKCMY